MSRTNRRLPYGYPHRKPRTLNEIKARDAVCLEMDDSQDIGCRVSQRSRFIPTAWDDLLASSWHQQDHR